MKPRRRLAKMTAAAAALVAALAAGELAVRLFHPMDALVYEDSSDPALAFELRPGASGMKNGVEVSISGQGLRDDAVPSPRPAGERRVVLVGGHETFGVGVPAEQTFVRRLAGELAERGQGPVRTINLSMYSYRLSQKVELACLRLKDLEPDWAVLQVTEGEMGGPRPPLLNFPRFKNWIRARSALARWASERYYLRPGHGIPPAADFTPVRADLRRFKGCAEAAGARAAVVVVPDLSIEPAGASSAFRRTLEAAAKEGAMPLLDGGPALRSLPPGERLLFPPAPFLSPAAHRVLSGAVGRWLKPLLRRRPPPKTPPRRSEA